MNALFRFSLIALLVFALFASLTPTASACPPGFAFRGAVDPGCGCGVTTAVPAPVAPLFVPAVSAYATQVRFGYNAQSFADPCVSAGPRFAVGFNAAVPYATGFGFRGGFDPFSRGRFFNPFFGRHVGFHGGFHGHVGHH